MQLYFLPSMDLFSYNYMKFYSLILMSLYDSRYCYNIINYCNYGQDNYSYIFNNLLREELSLSAGLI